MRNYKKEYENYHSRPEQKLRRAARNAARASLKKSTAPEKLEGKDVHHTKDGRLVLTSVLNNRGNYGKGTKNE